MVILEKMKNFKVKKEKILNSKDFVVLALLSNTFFLSVINAERFPQRGQVGNKITKKQSLEGVPEQGSRACNCFVPHGRRRLIGILCLCGHQLHSLLTRSLNVLKSTTAATCGGSFSGASKPILQANIDFTQHFSKSTRHFWKYFVVFPSLLLAGAKTLRRLDPRALGAAGATSRGRYEPRTLPSPPKPIFMSQNSFRNLQDFAHVWKYLVGFPLFFFQALASCWRCFKCVL